MGKEKGAAEGCTTRKFLTGPGEKKQTFYHPTSNGRLDLRVYRKKRHSACDALQH